MLSPHLTPYDVAALNPGSTVTRGNIHHPFVEGNPAWRGVADDGRPRGIPPRQSGRIDVNDHRVARCPGALEAFKGGIEQRMLAPVWVGGKSAGPVIREVIPDEDLLGRSC
jgi:hypothetical protein